jgi:hypothetical protein
MAGFSAVTVLPLEAQVIVVGEGTQGAREVGPVDHIIVATGQRPDLNLTRELRLALDPWLENAKALGPLIAPNLHSCGSVPPHGHRELVHPEPGFYTVGIKSYGRAPTFLMLTGYEQVRSVAAAIAGDLAEADNINLVRPETGACSAGVITDGELVSSGCCGGPAPAHVTPAARRMPRRRMRAKRDAGVTQLLRESRRSYGASGRGHEGARAQRLHGAVQAPLQGRACR